MLTLLLQKRVSATRNLVVRSSASTVAQGFGVIAKTLNGYAMSHWGKPKPWPKFWALIFLLWFGRSTSD